MLTLVTATGLLGGPPTQRGTYNIVLESCNALGEKPCSRLCSRLRAVPRPLFGLARQLPLYFRSHAGSGARRRRYSR